MLVKEIMSTDVISIVPEAYLESAAKKMRDHDIGFLMVSDDDNELLGVVTDRDIVCRGLAEGVSVFELSVADVMTPHAIWCSENEDIGDAARLMELNKVRRLPVQSRRAKIVGLLSFTDISAHASQVLAGEIASAVAEGAKRTPAPPENKTN